MSLEAFYPAKIENIWHKGRAGNRYRLDFLTFLINSKEFLFENKHLEVEVVDEKDASVLELAHSTKLTGSYKTGEPKELANSSGVLWQPGFFEWIVNTAWAHIYATETALNRKSPVLVLANSGHHAEYERGFGFCAVNSLIIATKYLLNHGLVNRVAILDLDVHYGNGTHSLAKNDPRILSTDIWKYKLDQWTYTENGENTIHIKVDDKDQYFEALQKILEFIVSFDPGIVLYHPALDVLETDRMGGVKGFDREALLTRERKVGEFLRKNNLLFIIGPGGSYIDHSTSEGNVEIQRKRILETFSDSISSLLGT